MSMIDDLTSQLASQFNAKNPGSNLQGGGSIQDFMNRLTQAGQSNVTNQVQGATSKTQGNIDQITQSLLNSKIPNFDFLQNYLQGGAQNGMPFKDQLAQTSEGAINTQYNQAQQNMAQSLSGKGLGRSGIGIAAAQGLEGQRSGALNQATANLNQEDIAYRNNAIAQLLGLSTSQAGLTQQGQGMALSGNLQSQGQGLQMQEFLQNLFEHQSEFSRQLDSQNNQFGNTFLGSLLGTVGKAFGNLPFTQRNASGDQSKAIYGQPNLA